MNTEPLPQLLVSVTFKFNSASTANFAPCLAFLKQVQELGLLPVVDLVDQATDAVPIKTPPIPATVPVTPTATAAAAAAPTSDKRPPGRPRKDNGSKVAAGTVVPDKKSAAPVVDLNTDDQDMFEDSAEDDVAADSMSNLEGKEQGQHIIRSIFNAGHRDQCRALARKWAVTSFKDIPEARGLVFYKEVVTLAESVGMAP